MSGWMSDPYPAANNPKPVQTQDDREGTRRTVASWLTALGGQKKKKSSDDAGLRRERAQVYPRFQGREHSIPIVESRSRPTGSRDPSLDSTTSLRTMATYHGSERLSNLYIDYDELQLGAGEPSEAQPGDLRVNPALTSNDRAKPTLRPWINVPPAPIHGYIHRKSLEDAICKMLSEGGARIALVGKSGIGKSQLALQIAQKTTESWPQTHVLWLPGGNSEDLKRSIDAIRELLGLTGSEIEAEQLFARFRKWLLDPSNGEWLIVLDGFDFVHQPPERMRKQRLLESIPVVKYCSTILTLRYSGDYSEPVLAAYIVEVPPVSGEEARSYLERRLAEPDTMNVMSHLASELGGIPLALAQVAEFIEGSGVALRKYIKLLRLERVKEVDTRGPVMNSERSLDAADLARMIVEGARKNLESASVRRTEPSVTAKDSGYDSYESGSIVQEGTEGQQEEASDLQSVRTLSSFVDLGLDGRLRGINVFARDLAQSLSPDIPEFVGGRELVVVAVQDALRAYSYSLEQQNRPSKLSDERKAAHFVRQQSHDIAVKIVDYIARASSVESGECPSEAGMFAEPINVLSWVGDSLTTAPDASPVKAEFSPFTAEDSNQTTIDKDSAREDTQLDDTIQRMRGFLSDNATFEWLKQRVQSVMSTGGGGELTAVSKKLSSILKQGFSAANSQNFEYSVDWDPLEFMRCNYGGYVDIANVISVNSDGKTYEACTVGEHIARVWPVTGPRFLEAVRSWWRHVSDGSAEEPFMCSLLDGQVTFTRRTSLVCVEIAGPMFLSLEVGEQLAWLASICRKGMFLDQLTLVSAIVSQASGKNVVGSGTTVNISFACEKFTQDAQSVDDCCWLKLFCNCCIANGVSVNARQEDEKGLEITFSLMATLGGFDRVANYAGQLVLKGFETLFVPMRKTGESIIWHLITKPNGRRVSYNAMYTLSDQPDATVCMQDLYDSRHFLGWVSNASQHAGTEDGVYNRNNEVYLEQPGQGLVLERVTISISKIVSIGTSITPGRQDRNIRTSSKDRFHTDIVHKMAKMHVLLYDHDDGRGWLVDGASAILHLLRFHVEFYPPICDGETFKLDQFRHADSEAGFKSAKDVLLSPELQNVVLVEEPAVEIEKQITETIDGKATSKTVTERSVRKKRVVDRVAELYEILELMYDNWKRRKNAAGVALESLNMKLEGWKFQDIVELEDDMNPVVARLDGSADDWLRMVRHINAVVLIGNGFGEMMKPMGDFCANWGSVPRKNFCVAVPVSRLKRIAQKYGDPRMVPLKLTPDVFWPINHHPFICTCATSGPGRSTCHRGQTLRPNCLRSGSLQLNILTAAEHANGAVIFEGRRSVKQVAQRATDQSSEHHKSPEKSAWLKKIRNRFRRGNGNGPTSSAAA